MFPQFLREPFPVPLSLVLQRAVAFAICMFRGHFAELADSDIGDSEDADRLTVRSQDDVRTSHRRYRGVFDVK